MDPLLAAFDLPDSFVAPVANAFLISAASFSSVCDDLLCRVEDIVSRSKDSRYYRCAAATWNLRVVERNVVDEDGKKKLSPGVRIRVGK
jgi:hypothetical protein